MRKRIKAYLAQRKDRKWVESMKSIQNQIVHDPRRLKNVNVTLSDEQKREIDDFFIANYGEKIDYTCHQTYTAYSGKFDVAYFPEQLYIPELEHYLNVNDDYCKVLEDKNIMCHIAKSIGINVPVDYARCMDGMIVENNGNILSKKELVDIILKQGEVFVKPTKNSGGVINV